MIQNILQWIKDNFVTVACILVVLLSLGAFYWPVHLKGAALMDSMSAQNTTIQQLKSYQRRSVQIPPENPDNPNTRIDMPVTPPAIETLQKVYNDLDAQFKGIYRLAHERNRAGHQPMLDGLFPAPVDRAKPFNARAEFVKGFYALYAALNAGQPPTSTEVTEAMNREEALLRQAFILAPDAQLTPQQDKELKQKQAERLVKLYQRQAGRIHMYSVEPVLTFQKWNPGPFQVGDWARSASPRMSQIWEGQMQLWIQQDLVQALRIANETTNPQTSVLQQPVKRLLAMYVEPDYIGLEEPENQLTDTQNMTEKDIEAAVLAAQAETKVEPADELKAYQEKIGARLPNNFGASPTGRQSNVIYDVRHAVLSVVVDSRQIPKLLNAIGQVNYMTVFSTTITDVDDYAELSQGYYYGPGVDAVKLDLKIETIWLRSWTAGDINPVQAQQASPPRPFNAGLMPNIVRYQLGLPLRTGQANTIVAPPETPETPESPDTPDAPGGPAAPTPTTP